MKVVIFGDVHGLVGRYDIPAVELVVDIVDRTDADLFLQVGDMGGCKPMPKPLHWIFGNNDSLSLMRAFSNGDAPVENIIHIPTGRTIDFHLGGETLTIAGLNGAYDPLYYDFHREDLDDYGYFTREEAESCLKLKGVDIFLAHGCPAGMGFGREPDYGNPAIRRIVDSVKPRYMFCGHGHFYREAVQDDCRVYSLDEVRRSYYVLDTLSGVLTSIRSDPSRLPRELGLGNR